MFQKDDHLSIRALHIHVIKKEQDQYHNGKMSMDNATQGTQNKQKLN